MNDDDDNDNDDNALLFPANGAPPLPTLIVEELDDSAELIGFGHLDGDQTGDPVPLVLLGDDDDDQEETGLYYRPVPKTEDQP